MPPIRPVNVQRVFLYQQSPQALVIYTVPAGSLLVLDDASAEVVDSATASMPGHPGIIPDVPVYLGLRTNPSGTVDFGSADHTIVGGIGLPIYGGRRVRGYAAPGTDVLVLLGGSNRTLNFSVSFAGHLVDEAGESPRRQGATSKAARTNSARRRRPGRGR